MTFTKKALVVVSLLFAAPILLSACNPNGLDFEDRLNQRDGGTHAPSDSSGNAPGNQPDK